MWSSAPAATATDTFMMLNCNFNICATDILTATAASTSCKGIQLNHPRDTDAFKPDHPTHSAESNGKQRTAAANQKAANFLPSHWWPTGWTFKTTYFHTVADKALQPFISCLCYRRRKPTQHIRTFKLLQKSLVCDELPTDWHTALLLADTPAPGASPPTTTASQTRKSAATSPASNSSAVSRHQTAATVEHLPCLQSVLFRTTAVNNFKFHYRALSAIVFLIKKSFEVKKNFKILKNNLKKYFELL